MINKKGKVLTGVIAGALVLALVGCGTTAPSTPNTPSAPTAQAVTLTGAGSTFMQPLLAQQIAEYNKQHSNITINYQDKCPLEWQELFLILSVR